MSRYRIKGSYTEDYNTVEVSGAIEITIPLLSESGKLKWGIDTMLSNLYRNEIYPTEEGMDLLYLAALVYLADTKISRVVHSQNSWTREIEIELPVANPDRWNQRRHILMEMLNYLSGDRWSILFVQRDNHIVSRVDGE